MAIEHSFASNPSPIDVIQKLSPSCTKGNPKGFSSITFEKSKLGTPNFAKCNFDNIYIGGCDQTLDPPQNLGGGKVQIWETV